VPKNWHKFCDQITDNFRVINPADFRILKSAGYTKKNEKLNAKIPISTFNPSGSSPHL